VNFWIFTGQEKILKILNNTVIMPFPNFNPSCEFALTVLDFYRIRKRKKPPIPPILFIGALIDLPTNFGFYMPHEITDSLPLTSLRKKVSFSTTPIYSAEYIPSY
jgi:hypothetical protein